jgi:hypothetical protein
VTVPTGLPAVLALVRSGYGVGLLVAPAAVFAAGGGSDAVVRGVGRVLGARQLAQAAAGVLAPRLVTPQRGAVIDGLHAASMVGWAAFDRAHRRPALLSAATAGLFAAAGASLTDR